MDEEKVTNQTETTETETTDNANTSEQSTTLSNEDKINNMYDANIASKRTGLENQMNQALSTAQANKDKIADTFNTQRNAISAEYERQKRNNNLQADKNGLNTGAASQMSLGQMNAYQGSQTQLGKEQANQETEADRNMETIRQNYQTQIAQAEADNDFEKMQALYNEGVRAEEQARDDAGVRASFGDFSGYTAIYGEAVANTMQKTWALQNPDIAYNLGYISADEYNAMTGHYPNGYGAVYGGGGYYGGGYYTTGSDDTPGGKGNTTAVGTNITPGTGTKGTISTSDPNSPANVYSTSSHNYSGSGGSFASNTATYNGTGNTTWDRANVAPSTSHNYIADGWNALTNHISNVNKSDPTLVK